MYEKISKKKLNKGLDRCLEICYTKYNKTNKGNAHNQRKVVDTMTKMTYVSALDVAINTVSDEAVKEKLEALRAQIAKKNSAERKPTKAQVANDGLRADIVDFLGGCDEPMTATDIASHFGVSNQKVTALMGRLLEDGAVVREVVKRKAYFKVA